MTVAIESSFASIAHLRGIATPAAEFRVLAFGLPELDGRLGAGGLRAGGLHEATAQSCSLVDDAAATLFLAGIAAREAHAAGGPVLWASSRTDLYAPGLEQAGLAAADVIYAQPSDDAALLAVIEDAIRDGTPSAVVAEASRVPMVATRRLQLVAAEADMPVLLLRRRRGRDRDPLRSLRPPGRAGGSVACLLNGCACRGSGGCAGRSNLSRGDLDETVAATRMRLCGRDGGEIVAARQAMQGRIGVDRRSATISVSG